MPSLEIPEGFGCIFWSLVALVFWTALATVIIISVEVWR